MNHQSDIKVTSSIDQAAKEILQKSFCVFQTGPVVTNQICRSRTEGLKILDQPTSALELLNRNCHRIVDGNLHGFHLPSPAKRLFRAFPSSDSQPWPNHDFQSSSKALASSLHEILVAIVQKLLLKDEISVESNGNRQKIIMETDQTLQQSDHEMCQQTRKRKRRSDAELSAECTNTAVGDCPSKKNATSDTPSTILFHTAKCPLDYFFYHNRGDPRRQINNCSEHIDRGALICVCLSSASSGLEVLPRGEKDFVCPEASLIHNNKTLYEERINPVSGLICIMAGDQLGALIGMTERRMACVHRVRNNLARARLSISYELRLL